MVVIRGVVFGLILVGLVFVAQAAEPAADEAEGGDEPKAEDEKPRAEFTKEQKLWALATCAVLTERNRGRHDLLGGCERTEERIEAWRKSLRRWWGVKNREDLLDVMDWLRREGHRKGFDKLGAYIGSLSPEQLQALRERVKDDPEQKNQVAIAEQYCEQLGDKSLKGWDGSRYVALCGWGYIAGYLTEKEAYELMVPAARFLQKTFDSWEDLGDNYLIGRQYWSWAQTQESGARYWQAVEKLCSDPESPWVKLPWDLDLGGDEEEDQEQPKAGEQTKDEEQKEEAHDED